MAPTRTNIDDPAAESASGNGFADDSESFLSGASLRQPAEVLGPRAQRTITRIVEATREVFLTRGYAGTTIDEIARVADVSRASFYTYFPSKREVLLAVGADSASQGETMIDKLGQHASSRAGLTAWVAEYFDLLDIHGSFAFAWTQAAHEDDEIRVAGMRRHYGLCKRFGQELLQSANRPIADPGPLGVVAFSVLERAWNYGQLYAEAVDRDALIRQSATALWGLARQPSNG